MLLDEAVLVPIVLLATMIAGLVAYQLREFGRARRPELPSEDRAPQGLSRLVPMGRELDRHIEQGLDALTDYLIGQRRSA